MSASPLNASKSKKTKNTENISFVGDTPNGTKKTNVILRQSIGIDIAKDKFEACFMVQKPDFHLVIKGSRSFENNKKGFEAFHLWLNKWRTAELECPIVMEATGVYYENLAYFLADNVKTCHICIALARNCKDYLKSLGKKSKTDKIDAQGIAQMGVERRLDIWKKPNATLIDLRSLTRERDALISERTVIKNQIHAEISGHKTSSMFLKRSEERIQLIDNQINDIEKEMSKTVNQNEDVKKRLDNVCTIPGVGKTTALIIIAETAGFELFKNQRQLTSYAGLDVVHHESGTSVKAKGRISKRGNKHIRKALFFPSLTHVRQKGIMSNTFFNVLENTKIKMKGYVAVQRKMLGLIYVIYKTNKPYNEMHKEQLNELKKQAILTEIIQNS